MRELFWIGSNKDDLRRFRFEDAIYVLHCFQKKSRHGVETPKKELELIQARLKWAEDDYRQQKGKRA